jgi:hypothetical protein
MSAALRTTQATPSMRPLGVAFGAIVVSASIVGLLAVGQFATARPRTVSAAGAAPVTHDHGWSSAAAVTAPVLNDRGWATAPSASAPSVAPGGSRSGGHGGSHGSRFRK